MACNGLQPGKKNSITRRFEAHKDFETQVQPYKTGLARLSAKARSLDADAAKQRRKYAILRPKACCDEDGDSDPDHSDESGSSSSSSSSYSSSTGSSSSDENV